VAHVAALLRLVGDRGVYPLRVGTLTAPQFVQISPQPLDRYRPLLGDRRWAEVEAIAERARREFAGRAIWHISSTARGGGVAELLASLLGYVRGVGVDTRWVVISGEPRFFEVTKRLHNRLHGGDGEDGELGDDEREVYEEVLARNEAELERLTRPGDVTYLHDPQTAGLVPMLCDLGVRVIWRCHIGTDHPDRSVRQAWDFLRRYVEGAAAYVFSRSEYVWEGLDPDKVWLVPPAIDPFSPKNQEIEPAVVDSILGTIGLVADRTAETAPVFVRGDGTPGRVDREGDLLQEGPVPAGARIVAQVSRWDRLKDPEGVLECFDRHVPDPSAHLVLGAPSTAAVTDDPEGQEVFSRLADRWRELPEERRRRIHLVSLPMDDLDENAAMVNALQRRADVVVQKSLAEGFGLTVTEAMWKRRPVVGSRTGGIREQIVDGESGVLVDDPRDLEGFGRAIASLLDDPARARRIGEAAHNRVVDHFLGVNRLVQYVELVGGLLSETPSTGSRPVQ
jgi:trehalose synthase